MEIIAQQNCQSMHNKTVKICTTKLSKYAQQNCRNLHNKLLKKCTIHIANSRKICYSRKEGESNEVN